MKELPTNSALRVSGWSLYLSCIVLPCGLWQFLIIFWKPLPRRQSCRVFAASTGVTIITLEVDKCLWRHQHDNNNDDNVDIDDGDADTHRTSVWQATECLTFTIANKFLAVVIMVFVKLQMTPYKQWHICTNIHSIHDDTGMLLCHRT